MKTTVLYETHQKLGAKIVEFGGWQMPLQYKGIVHEHHIVRSAVGLFDVSHMGRLIIQGRQAEELLEKLCTNQISGKPDGSSTYTVWCNEEGYCVDDLLVYKENATRFFVIVNASNRDKDLAHLLKYASQYDVTIETRYDQDGILALQGPKSKETISSIFPGAAEIKPKHFAQFSFQGKPVIVSRTGYTGEDGFELYAENSLIMTLWVAILKSGKSYGIEPIGLGARDLLRLEMGYALYGHEIDETIAVTESVSAWTVKWTKEFIGKEALQNLETSPLKRKEYGVLVEQGIARQGYPVLYQGTPIGNVTSGTFSPIQNQAIAIVLVDKNLKDGDSVDICIRDNKSTARIVPLPFIKINRDHT